MAEQCSCIASTDHAAYLHVIAPVSHDMHALCDPATCNVKILQEQKTNMLQSIAYLLLLNDNDCCRLRHGPKAKHYTRVCLQECVC